MSPKTVDVKWYQSWPSISAVEEKTIYPNQGEVNSFSEGEKFYFKNWAAWTWLFFLRESVIKVYACIIIMCHLLAYFPPSLETTVDNSPDLLKSSSKKQPFFAVDPTTDQKWPF